MNPKVIFVPYGVANRFGEVIEVHQDLKKYPSLLKPILEHEMSHTNLPGWTWKDFKLDFFENNKSLKRWEVYGFMVKRPSTWIQILPFYFHPKRGFVIDINRSLFYLICLFIVSLTFVSMILIK